MRFYKHLGARNGRGVGCHFSSYYCNQAGHGLSGGGGGGLALVGGGGPDFNIFRGVPYQRGYGIFSNAFRRYGIPLLKYLGPKLLKRGRDIYANVSSGHVPLREAIRSSLKEGGKEILVDSLSKAASVATETFGGQSGSGFYFPTRRRRRRTTKTATTKKRKSTTRKKKKATRKRATTTSTRRKRRQVGSRRKSSKRVIFG